MWDDGLAIRAKLREFDLSVMLQKPQQPVWPLCKVTEASKDDFGLSVKLQKHQKDDFGLSVKLQRPQKIDLGSL
jgi:hypothetical protein